MLLMWVMALTVGGRIYLVRTGGLDWMVALASVPASTRTDTRNGQSLGEILVEEGLARRWDGARRGWCHS